MASVDDLIPLPLEASDGAANSNQKRLIATVRSHQSVLESLITSGGAGGGFIVDPDDPDYLLVP